MKSFNTAPVILHYVVHNACALGNYQLTDLSWNTLFRSSQGLRRLHAAECPGMTDASLKSVASLQHLRYLNISYCNRCVLVCDDRSLTFHTFSLHFFK